MMVHSITFIRAREIVLVESGPYSKHPGVFLSHMRWDGMTRPGFEHVLLNLSKYIPTYI